MLLPETRESSAPMQNSTRSLISVFGEQTGTQYSALSGGCKHSPTLILSWMHFTIVPRHLQFAAFSKSLSFRLSKFLFTQPCSLRRLRKMHTLSVFLRSYWSSRYVSQRRQVPPPLTLPLWASGHLSQRLFQSTGKLFVLLSSSLLFQACRYGSR
jgi:hypothetical protein